MSKKIFISLLALIALSLVVFKLKYSNKQAPTSSKPSSTSQSNNSSSKLVAFDDFWDKVKSQSQQIFPQQTVYLAGIKSDFAIKQPQADGKADSWKAHIVVCDDIKDVRDNDADKVEKICHGKAKYLTMNRKGVKIEDDLSYYGHVIKFEDLKITPQKAMSLANQAKNYQPNGKEIYLYNLVIGRWHNTPIWEITKKCSVLGEDNSCGPNWVVKINALTGDLVE